MIDTKLLRQKILDLAIRGKLVPQDPNDEPASVLLQKIKEEKTAQVKAGKIKKDKHESVIFRGDDKHYYEQVDGKTTDITAEIPFDVPDGWAWTRLNELGNYRKGPFGSSITKSMFVPQGHDTYKVYEQRNAIYKDVSIGNYYISENKYEELKGFAIAPADIIVSCAGTIGESFVLPHNCPRGIINQALMRIRLYCHEISNFYLLYFDSILKKEALAAGKGSAIKNIPPFDVLKRMFIAIPPLSEQMRIVDQLKQFFRMIDTIDADASVLDNALSLTKQKILDLAIRGKLVPQAPNDEPASALLKKIKIEKEALVKSGKIKRDKHESFIFRGDDNRYYEDDGKKQTDITSEILFDLPINWIWLRLKTAILPTGSRIPKTLEFEYIDIDSIDNHRQCIIEPKRLFTKDAPSRASRDVQAGDTLFSLVRPYLKNIAFVKKIHEDSIASTGFFVCRPSCGFIHKFLYWLMVCDYTVQGINKHMKGDNSPSVRREDIENFMIPLPPLAEQKRIVSQIERVFAQVETMQQ